MTLLLNHIRWRKTSTALIARRHRVDEEQGVHQQVLQCPAPFSNCCVSA
jgi:hypothetical protein